MLGFCSFVSELIEELATRRDMKIGIYNMNLGSESNYEF